MTRLGLEGNLNASLIHFINCFRLKERLIHCECSNYYNFVHTWLREHIQKKTYFESIFSSLLILKYFFPQIQTRYWGEMIVIKTAINNQILAVTRRKDQVKITLINYIKPSYIKWLWNILIVITLMSLHCLPIGTLNTTEKNDDSQLRNRA